MFNYYKQQAIESTRNSEGVILNTQHSYLVRRQIKNADLLNNYQKRVMIFMQKMKQQPFQLHRDVSSNRSIQPKQTKRNRIPALSLHNPPKQLTNVNHSHYEGLEISTDLECLDKFKPQSVVEDELLPRQPSYKMVDSAAIRKTLRINSERVAQKKRSKPTALNDHLYFNALKHITVSQPGTFTYYNKEQKQIFGDDLAKQARGILERCHIFEDRRHKD